MPKVTVQLHIQQLEVSNKKKLSPTFGKKECTRDNISMSLKKAREYETLKGAINAYLQLQADYKNFEVSKMYLRDLEADAPNALGIWIISSVLIEKWFGEYEHGNVVDVGVIVDAVPPEDESSESDSEGERATRAAKRQKSNSGGARSRSRSGSGSGSRPRRREPEPENPWAPVERVFCVRSALVWKPTGGGQLEVSTAAPWKITLHDGEFADGDPTLGAVYRTHRGTGAICFEGGNCDDFLDQIDLESAEYMDAGAAEKPATPCLDSLYCALRKGAFAGVAASGVSAAPKSKLYVATRGSRGGPRRAVVEMTRRELSQCISRCNGGEVVHLALGGSSDGGAGAAPYAATSSDDAGLAELVSKPSARTAARGQISASLVNTSAFNTRANAVYVMPPNSAARAVLTNAIAKGEFAIPALPDGLLALSDLTSLTEFFQGKVDARAGMTKMPALRRACAGGAVQELAGAANSGATEADPIVRLLGLHMLQRQQQQIAPGAGVTEIMQLLERQDRQRQQQQAAQQQQQAAQQQQQQQMMMQMMMMRPQFSQLIPAPRPVSTRTPAGADFTLKYAFDGAAYASIGGISVALGVAVTLISKSGGWASVRTADGREGLVPMDRLEASPGLPPPPPPPLPPSLQ
jgi:hypothetical protein